MEEPEEISDPRGDSLMDQISEKIPGDENSSADSEPESDVQGTPQPLQLQRHPRNHNHHHHHHHHQQEQQQEQQQTSFAREGMSRVFVREKPVEKMLDEDQPADIFLWKNKKQSAAVLGVATAIWVCFEWLEYHLLTLICHFVIFGLGFLFLWSNVSTLIHKKPPHIPEVRLPEEPFMGVASVFHQEINDALAGLREIAAGRDLKRFLTVVGVMWVLSIIGSFCNFLTLIYVVFVFLYTVPVLYETYNEKIDAFAETAITEIQKQYAVFDSKVLRKIPKVPLHLKKKVE